MNSDSKGTHENDFEVLILAPVGKDASAATEVLLNAQIQARPFKTLPELCERLKMPAGVVLISEEALTQENIGHFKQVLSEQQPWSSIPVILMSSNKDRVFTIEDILDVVRMSGSVSILERPFRVSTFLASIRVALEAREKQYQVRDLLEEQRMAVEKQKLAIQQRDDFLSIASHELKTPITSLKIQVQMRKRSLDRGDHSMISPEKTIALIDTTEKQLEKLSRLVDEMLDISRIVNGKLALNREFVSLDRMVQEVLSHFSPQFEAAGCTVDLNVENEVSGMWDRYRLEQVIANLFTNSIKYGSGSPVSIIVKSVEDQAIFLIRDQGMGVAPENQERIFQRFERAVDGSRISGLGLGLYISREIINLHYGSIRVESELGKGSTFIIEIPIAIGETNNAN